MKGSDAPRERVEQDREVQREHRLLTGARAECVLVPLERGDRWEKCRSRGEDRRLVEPTSLAGSMQVRVRLVRTEWPSVGTALGG